MPRGEIAFRNGDNYEGQLANGQPSGQGLYRFSTGAIYTGSFRDGLFHGMGTLKDPFTGITITGPFKAGLADGTCRVQYADGHVYDGQMKQGLRHGKGSLTFPAGAQEKCYRGQFQADQMNGKGQLSFRNGTRYKGRFVCGSPQGDFQITDEAFCYVGEVKQGIVSGKGSVRFASGDLYEGQLQNNQIHGTGRYTYADGSVFTGHWQKGQKRGKGQLTFPNGNNLVGSWNQEGFEGCGLWNNWEVQGCSKGQSLEGPIRLSQQGVDVEMFLDRGATEGCVRISKRIGQQLVTYRGQFERGMEKPYTVTYSKRI